MENIQFIDSICTTDTKKLFNIVVNDTLLSYVADIEEAPNDTLNNQITYGKGNISTEIGIINNMYSVDRFFIKSAAKVGYGTSTYDYANIFSHHIDSLIQTIQIDNVIYGITTYDNFGHYNLTQDIYSYISSDTDRVLPPDTNISTLIFDKDELKKGNFDSSVKQNIPNINYNKLIEFPGNEFNDNDSGNYIGNVYNTKNHYSSRYNMEHLTCTLENARKYVGVGSFNSTLYLKYYDNLNYQNNGSLEFKNNQLKYQNIEVIGALNRKYSNIEHKTNLYSLNVGVKFNPIIKNKEATLATIQLQIKNNITQYLKTLTPANTQLFKINFN